MTDVTLHHKPNKITPPGADRHVHPAVEALQKVLAEHLAAHPQLTLNGISKRCSVSEPTLRRLMNGSTKSIANVSTLVDILSYVSKETQIYKLVRLYPGPIAEHLRQNLGRACDEDANYQQSAQLNMALSDPYNYLIYNLSVGELGVSREEVLNLFGLFGQTRLEGLVQEGLIELRGPRYFGLISTFTLPHSTFVSHFKAMADFIKPEKVGQAQYNNIFAKYHESVNIEAYRKIVQIQQTALKNILKIMDSPGSKGIIPMFVLSSVDTLSKKSASELQSAHVQEFTN